MYFVTIVTQDRACLFGEAISGQLLLSDAGRMVEHWWLELSGKFPEMDAGEHVVMPNHFHGIAAIVGKATSARPGAHAGAPLQTAVQWFKTMTTNEYIRGVNELGWPAFRARLWQRDYYEHIIRNERSLNRVREYIADNPARWAIDRENPASTGPPEADDPWSR